MIPILGQEPKKRAFCSLHTHTTFSHGDGFNLPKEHVQRVDELGMWAVAVTEHRNTSSHPQFERYGKEMGVHTIYGCEFNVTLGDVKERKQFHQTVLAMDEQGYRNLNRLVSLGYKQSYQWPRIYAEQLLDPKLTQGLIVLSGCADSYLSCVILGGKAFGDKRDDWEQEDILAGKELIERYQDVYGDRYYLEVQQFPGLERSTILNQAFMDLSSVTGAKAVATADVHYCHGEDNEMQKLLHAAHRGNTSTDWEYDILLTYPETDAQVFDAFKQQQLTDDEAWGAINESSAIAARCQVELPKNERIRYPGPNSPAYQRATKGMTNKQKADRLLKLWIEEGIDYRLKTSKGFYERWNADENAMIARIQREFKVISDKDFSDYFLVTADLIQWAKSMDIGVGPGRGSAAGSLLCYLLRITEIDPTQNPLMIFERFIDPSRPDMPDIDIDFQDDRRHEVFEYAAEKYQSEKVANIGNFQRYRGKTAVNDLGWVLDVSPAAIKQITKLIVDRPDGDPRENDSVEDTIEAFPEAAAVIEKHPKLALAAKLEGNHKTLGIHAAGLVISNRPITDICAVYSKKDKNDNIVASVIAYDKIDAEYLEMLKLDILGLKTMGILADVIKWTDMTWEKLYSMELDDPAILEGFRRNDLVGIFQFEGRTTRSIVEKIYAKGNEQGRIDIDVLADINALSRPGALISGMTAEYIKVARGEKPKSDRGYETVNEIFGYTNGCLVFQEQVMRMGSDIGGFPGDKVGALRKIIGKKKAGGAFDEFYTAFEEGAAERHQMTSEDAKELWDFMAASSSYLFNVAHAFSYAVIAYWAMYCKIHYPVEFYAASLRRAKKTAEKDPALALMQDAIRHGIEVLPPDMERSAWNWIPERGALRAGFEQIDGVGEPTAKACEKWRDEEREIRDQTHIGANAPWNWSDMMYVGPKYKEIRVPSEPWWELCTRTRTRVLDDGTKEKYKIKEEVLRDYRKEKIESAPARGVKGIGKTTLATIEAFTSSDDPFGIYHATDSVGRVVRAIEMGYLPLTEADADASQLGMRPDEPVVFVGLVKELKLIDVIDDQRRRENKTTEEVLAELRDPHLHTKAKLVCVDGHGTDVHINIHRWMYPHLEEDLKELNCGVDVAHVMGISRTGFGPTIQAKSVQLIEPPEEDEEA